MPVNGIDDTIAALLQLRNNNSLTNTSNTFKNVLANESVSFQSSEQNAKEAYETQYDLLSNLNLSDMSGVLLAELLRQAALSGSGVTNIGAVLAQMTQSGRLVQNLPTNDMEQARTGYKASGIPKEAWKPVYPSVTSDFYDRSPALYRQVINQFSVETNPRYAVNKNGNNDTYCNIFMWDVTRAMGAEIPHYINPVTNAPMHYPDVEGAKQLTANRIYDWLHKSGESYGWFEVSPEQAQELANQGRPVVTALRNNSGGHGHVQVVCPSKDGLYDETRGVTIAQAGRNLTSYRPITEIYNASLSKVAYFAHI